MSANVPKLRFPGFTDPWEQRKLGEVADSFEYGLNAAAKEFDGANKYIRITDIDDSTHEFLKTDLTSPDTTLEQAGNYKLNEGDILFARTGASVGKTYIYKPSDGLVYYAGFLIRARINKKYDPQFIFQKTLTPDYDRYIRITSQRSGQPGVNAQEYADYDFMVPGFDEQKKIGEFLRCIDNLITLHQRKCDELEEFKSALVQKLFPPIGETLPEKRYPEFTDPWRLCTLGDLYTERNERGNDSLSILSVSIHSGVSDTELDEESLGKQVRRSEDKSLYKHVYEGDLVFNMMRAWQGAIGVVKSEGMISPAYISAIPNEDVYPEFMDYCLRRKEVINEINNLSYGVTDFRKRLYWDSFVKVRISLPSVEEQKKITGVLQKVDHLIERYRQKMAALQEFKKAMLQQMFV